MRLVACDLDGTIVRFDGTISGRTVAALRACQDAGVHVVFVTGRPPRWMPQIAEVTGHRGLAICGNGALVIDLTDLRVVRASPLPPAAVLETARRLRARFPTAVFALETTTGYRREPEFLPRHETARAARADRLDLLLDDDPVVTKVLCRVDGGVADELLAGAREVLGGVAEPVHSNPDGDMLEISASGVSKGTALAELADERGVGAEQVVAFGDMPNDVPMLLWAGRGYAMAGGHPEAVAAASLVAPPCEEDGVAQVLEHLLAHGRPA
jgi:Cof subfamily protein (haloacid dehalogenase superfamily)